MNVKGIALRSALQLMLSRLPSNPTFVIADEVLLITTREGAAQRKLARIYNVDELVDQRQALPSPREAPPGYGRGGYGVEASYDGLSALANVIQQTIEPGTWGAENGCAVVPLVSKGRSLLVVRQSWPVHDEIESLLGSLGQLPDRAVGNPVDAPQLILPPPNRPGAEAPFGGRR
jgi:hypothetical protein